MLDANGLPVEEAAPVEEATPESEALAAEEIPGQTRGADGRFTSTTEEAPLNFALVEPGYPATEAAYAPEEDARLKAEALKAAREEEDARLKAEAESLKAARVAEDVQPHEPLQLEALKSTRTAQDVQIEADAEALAKKREEEDAKAEKVVVLSGNCDGELVALPDVAGVTHTQYKCKECGQLVHVGHEEREANGLPTQHHKLEEDK